MIHHLFIFNFHRIHPFMTQPTDQQEQTNSQKYETFQCFANFK